MKEHHATAGSAIAAVSNFLRSWEIDAALQFGRGSLRLSMTEPKSSTGIPRREVAPNVLAASAGSFVMLATRPLSI